MADSAEPDQAAEEHATLDDLLQARLYQLAKKQLEADLLEEEADERKQINVPAGNAPKNYQTYAAKLRSEDKSHKISTCIDPGRGNDKWDRDLYSVNTKQLIVAEKSEHSA